MSSKVRNTTAKAANNKKSGPHHSKISKKHIKSNRVKAAENIKTTISVKSAEKEKIVNEVETTVGKAESVKKTGPVKKTELIINKTSLFFNALVYVDSINGSDESKKGDFYLPFATVKRAMDYLSSDEIARENCAVIFKEGEYDITSCLQGKYNNFNSAYKNMNVSWIALPGYQGKVIIKSECSFENTCIDNDESYKMKMIFNGLVFKDMKGHGMTLNSDDKVNEYYNCVFDNIAVGGSSKIFKDAEVIVKQCLFINTTEGDSNFRISGRCVNSASTNDHIQPINKNNSRILYNCTIDENYNITSSEWQNSGEGSNFDGTDANIGVYGGEFAWKLCDGSLSEFKINNTTLKFNKFVYADAVNGNDETGNGEYNSPFKTIKKSMDYLNNSDVYRNNCAVILNNGTYDFSQCFNENGIDSKYSGMTISYIADISRQGKVFITSSSGFKGGVIDIDTKHSIKLKFYGVVFKSIENMSLNCDSGINEYYNCAFNDISFEKFESGSKSAKSVIRNCIFTNEHEDNIDYELDGICINSAISSKKISFTDCEISSVLNGCNIDEYYNVISEDCEHRGIGLNPDGSQAHIGVYGGSFAWQEHDYGCAEFKINNVALNFNKFVYVDSNNGNDEEGNGEFESPFKTLKKSMDYLCQNRILRKNCAVILKEGTYDISECLSENSDTLNEIYAGMNISYIGDIGHQGHIYMTSSKGFVPSIVKDNKTINIEIKFYGIVFKDIKGKGLGLNYDDSVNEYHNCVFDNIAVGGNSRVNKDSAAIIHNCLFINTSERDSDYKVAGQCINSATTNDHIQPSTIEMINVLYNCWVDCNYYSITSRGWLNTGIGNNPNGSQAHIGVYGGEFAWR